MKRFHYIVVELPTFKVWGNGVVTAENMESAKSKLSPVSKGFRIYFSEME